MPICSKVVVQEKHVKKNKTEVICLKEPLITDLLTSTTSLSVILHDLSSSEISSVFSCLFVFFPKKAFVLR